MKLCMNTAFAVETNTIRNHHLDVQKIRGLKNVYLKTLASITVISLIAEHARLFFESSKKKTKF